MATKTADAAGRHQGVYSALLCRQVGDAPLDLRVHAEGRVALVLHLRPVLVGVVLVPALEALGLILVVFLVLPFCLNFVKIPRFQNRHESKSGCRESHQKSSK